MTSTEAQNLSSWLRYVFLGEEGQFRGALRLPAAAEEQNISSQHTTTEALPQTTRYLPYLASLYRQTSGRGQRVDTFFLRRAVSLWEMLEATRKWFYA